MTLHHHRPRLPTITRTDVDGKNNKVVDWEGQGWCAYIGLQWRRRLQTMALLHYVVAWLLLPCLALWVPIYVFLFTQFWWTTLLYAVWFVYDRHTPQRGSRAVHWLKTCSMWSYFRQYFPIRLHRTVELPADRNYLFAIHPHGVLAISAFTSFSTDCTAFSKLFPGIRSHLLTLVGQFWFPGRREYGTLYGACEASRESIAYLYRERNAGVACALVVGGLREAWLTKTGQHVIYAMKRKGFIKLAIRHGADVVPVYAFGENELYTMLEHPTGSLLEEVQSKLKGVLGFAPPLFYGRGVFNYSFGMLPHRKALNTVVGSPILVEQCDEPSAEYIDEIHGLYVEQLVHIFDTHKLRFGLTQEDILTVL